MDIKVLIITLIRKFKVIVADENQPLELVCRALLRPAKGVHLKFIPREKVEYN